MDNTNTPPEAPLPAAEPAGSTNSSWRRTPQGTLTMLGIWVGTIGLYYALQLWILPMLGIET